MLFVALPRQIVLSMPWCTSLVTHCKCHVWSFRQKQLYEAYGNVFSARPEFSLGASDSNYNMNIDFFLRDPRNGRSNVFIRALAFLNQLIRDEQSDFSKMIMALFVSNKDLFSLVLMVLYFILAHAETHFHNQFQQMINTQYPTSIEFLVRLLRCGDRRRFRVSSEF